MAVVIRLQGLPVVAGSADIRRFFSGLNIPDGGVHIIGGEKGEAFIIFSTDEDARQGMSFSGGFIKDSRIELYLSSKTEMQNIIEVSRKRSDHGGRETGTGSRWAGSSSSGAGNFSNLVAAIKKGIGKSSYGSLDHMEDDFHSSGSHNSDTEVSKPTSNQSKKESFNSDNVYVFLRGLPYTASEDDVLNFFSELQVEGVILLQNENDLPSGDGVVKFATPNDAVKALQHNRDYMGSRYIERTFKKRIKLHAPKRTVAFKVSSKETCSTLPFKVCSKEIFGTLSFNVSYREIFGTLSFNISFKEIFGTLSFNIPFKEIFGTLSFNVPFKEIFGTFSFNISFKEIFGTLSFNVSFKESCGAFPFRLSSEDRCGTLPFTSLPFHSASFIKQGPPPFPDFHSEGNPGGFPEGHFMPDSNFRGGSDRITLIKMKNIPFRATPNEILDFFHGYKIIPESLSIHHNDYGMPSGEATLALVNYDEAMAAVNELNDRPFGHRKVRLTLA
ncbi:UNVERIFIED_CONTAM: hypothetical protein K2H54_034569 [Gekko kuhli]